MPAPTLSRLQRVDAVVDWLRPIAEPVAQEAEFARWIGARNADDPDPSANWCTACARVEVDRLNAINPEHEYFVDGGWGSPTDHPPSCGKCGKTLDDHLSEYAVRDEANHYSRYSVSLSAENRADRAFRFVQAFTSYGFDTTVPEVWQFFRKVERMYKRRGVPRQAAAA